MDSTNSVYGTCKANTGPDCKIVLRRLLFFSAKFQQQQLILGFFCVPQIKVIQSASRAKKKERKENDKMQTNRSLTHTGNEKPKHEWRRKIPQLILRIGQIDQMEERLKLLISDPFQMAPNRSKFIQNISVFRFQMQSFAIFGETFRSEA